MRGSQRFAWARRWTAEQWVWGGAAGAVVFFIFFRLGAIPSGLFVDETSLGFNARAIGRTLADQYGVTLPLFFRALEDYKSPLYVYPAAITETILGPSAFSLRLVSALYAIGMSLLLYRLLRRLTGKPELARWIALLSLLTPSLFLYARVSFSEASCIPFWVVLGMLLVLRFEQEPSRKTAVWAGVGLGIILYAYTTGRLLAPLMVAAAAVCFYRAPSYRKLLPAFLGGAALAAMPMALFFVRHPGMAEKRFALVSVWHDNPSVLLAAQRVTTSYLQHLANTDFLFRTGQHNLWHNAGFGLLPIWLFIPMVFGIGSLWNRRASPFALFLGAALLIAPIPVCLTFENLPHTSRFLHFAPLALILGALAISDWIDTAHPSRLLCALACAAALAEGGLYLYYYFVFYPADLAGFKLSWWPLQGLDQGVGGALQVAFKARSGETPLYLPDTFFLFDGSFLDFYGDLDPARLRNVGVGGFGIHALKPGPLPPGALFINAGTTKPAQNAELIGTSGHRADSGAPFWSVYRAL